MYLRTTSRKNRDGRVVEYYQLAHNERDPVTRKPVAHVIHNFGRADQVDRDQLIRLCKSIARVCNVDVIDRLAKDEPFGAAGGFPESFMLHRTYPYGPTLAIEALWEQLGIGECLRSLCSRLKYRVPYERAILAMVANRLCRPESKLGVWDRWLPTVYLPSCRDLKLAEMYEALDMLFEHSEEMEKEVFFRTANLFNLKVDLIFYDTTTASFSVDREDEDEAGIRKFGLAKEGFRTPQIVVALAVTPEGFPVKSWVLPGNTADVSTVEKVRADLRDWQLGRAIFVADAGMNSKDNREELARACGKYLLATRMASISEIKHEVLGKRVLETNDDTLSLEDAAEGYKGLMVIERCFRSLKRTQIKISPLYHWLPRRIEAHVKVCVLALLIERVAEHRCGQPWSRIKRGLDELQISNFSTDAYRLFRRNEITSNAHSTLKSLEIKPPPLIERLETIAETA